MNQARLAAAARFRVPSLPSATRGRLTTSSTCGSDTSGVGDIARDLAEVRGVGRKARAILGAPQPVATIFIALVIFCVFFTEAMRCGMDASA